MYSRWYEIAVVLLWLATMSWLVSQKVMPSLLAGDPPSAESMLEVRKPELPLCWSMAWNDRPLGWAVSTSTAQPDGSTKIRSQVHFDELPLSEMIPTPLKVMFPALTELDDQYQMDTLHILVFSNDGQLQRFESSVQFEPTRKAIEIYGVVEGAMLSLSVRAGELDFETEMKMPPKVVLSDSLSPEASLQNLYEGRHWTVKAYSPLRPPNSPIEILHAEVDGVQPIFWNGRPVDAWLVTYRADSGWIQRNSDRPRARLWVHPDGTVLKQESAVLDSVMTFVRLPEDEAAEMVKTLPELQPAQTKDAEPKALRSPPAILNSQPSILDPRPR